MIHLLLYSSIFLMVYFKYHDYSFTLYTYLYFCFFPSFIFKLHLFYKVFSKDWPAVLCIVFYLYNCSYVLRRGLAMLPRLALNSDSRVSLAVQVAGTTDVQQHTLLAFGYHASNFCSFCFLKLFCLFTFKCYPPSQFPPWKLPHSTPNPCLHKGAHPFTHPPP